MILSTLIMYAAESAGGGGGGWPELPLGAQYGLLGVGFAAIASGRFLAPRYVLDRERERSDRLEEENRRLNTLIQEKAIPAIVDASNAVRDSTLLVHDMKREKEIQREISERKREG